MRDCSGKKRFDSLPQASAALRTLRKNGVRMERAYWCEEHRCWHLTSRSLRSYLPPRS